MAVSVCLSLLLLSGLGDCTGLASLQAQTEFELKSGGTLAGVKSHRQSLLRRDASVDEAEAAPRGSELLQNSQRLYGVSDLKTRKEKVARGTAENPYAIYEGEYANDGGSFSSFHAAPDWAPHESMPVMPTCTLDVTTEMGLSDYGSILHGCASCAQNCTDDNKQHPTSVKWLMEPPLKSCNAHEVKIYLNWTNITQLGCSSCDDKGIRHKFEMEFETNAGEGVAGYENTELSFKAWMGPEVDGAPGAKTFPGKHVFEIEDTEEPSRSTDPNAPNPGGRWIAIPGGSRPGETFACTRICKTSHPCLHNRNTGVRCTAGIAMADKQVFSYHVKMIQPQAMVNMCVDFSEDGKECIEAANFSGSEWEVRAEDLTQTSPAIVVGRVVLEGNSGDYGIKEMSQTHEHLGCVPCDLFYESTVVTGPFILDPVNVHAVKTATGYPPTLTDQSCELFRMSALSGFAVKFESGPGLWPPFEVNDTLFTCNDNGGSTCPAR